MTRRSKEKKRFHSSADRTIPYLIDEECGVLRVVVERQKKQMEGWRSAQPWNKRTQSTQRGEAKIEHVQTLQMGSSLLVQRLRRDLWKKKASQINWRKKVLQVVHQYTNSEGVSFMSYDNQGSPLQLRPITHLWSSFQGREGEEKECVAGKTYVKH